jgi:hypothetical protein
LFKSIAVAISIARSVPVPGGCAIKLYKQLI